MNGARVQWPMLTSHSRAPEELRRDGPLISAWWTDPRVAGPLVRMNTYVLVDTGAGRTMVEEALAKEMRLPTLAEEVVIGIHGSSTLRKFESALVIPAIDCSGQHVAFRTPIHCCAARDLAAEYAPRGLSVVGILGRDFLQFCELEIDGTRGSVLVRVNQTVTMPRGSMNG